MDFAAWFKQLYITTGINLSIAYDPFDRTRFLHGLLVTIELSAITIVLSIVIGVIGAWLQSSRLVWTRRIVGGYIHFFRNTPPLVQLYFFYFGLSSLLPVVTRFGTTAPLLGGFAWVCISLSFFAGAFNVEVFRSGIEAVPRATIEAAESLGYTPLSVHADRPAARYPCLSAGAEQQFGQSRQDDHARLRGRRSGTPLRLRPDLVGQHQRAGDDGRVAHRLCRASGIARAVHAFAGA